MKFVVNSVKPKLTPVQEWILARERDGEESEPIRSQREDCPNFRLCETSQNIIYGYLLQSLPHWEALAKCRSVETLDEWYRVRRSLPSEPKPAKKAKPVEPELDELGRQLEAILAAM